MFCYERGIRYGLLPPLVSKLWTPLPSSSLRSSFEFLIDINPKTYTMNYIAFIFALICVIAKAALFGIAAYILYLIFIKKDKETINTVKDLKRLV